MEELEELLGRGPNELGVGVSWTRPVIGPAQRLVVGSRPDPSGTGRRPPADPRSLAPRPVADLEQPFSGVDRNDLTGADPSGEEEDCRGQDDDGRSAGRYVPTKSDRADGGSGYG
jgi:hypothetical protein